MSGQYINGKYIARQTESSKPSFSSTTATVSKRSTSVGAAHVVRPSSAYNDKQSKEHRTPYTNVLRSNERAGNSRGSGTASGDPVHETFSERDAKGTDFNYQNNFKLNDDKRWKYEEMSTESTRSAQNISQDTNNQDDSQFTAGKSSERAHGTSASNAEPSKQRYAKSEWSGSSNRYRVENSFGKDIKRPTYNERHADTSDKHTTEGDGHSGYNERSFNTQDTDDLTSTFELIQKVKSILPLADKSWLELSALKRKDAKTDTEHWKQQVETLQKVIDKLEDEKKGCQTEIKKVVLERDQALVQLKERDLELEREKATGNEHLSMLQQCNNELAKLGNENKTMLDELVRKKTQYDKLQENYNQATAKLGNENKTLRDELVRKKTQYDKLQENHTQVTADLADYKTRLSKLMGSRLADNNPDIADLSDRNRPTKLAEKYQELYDNEWTDAFEVFESHYGNESKAIKSLKIVLEHVKQICDELSEDQSKMLIASLTMKKTQGGSVSKDIMKQLKDLRRSTAENSVEGVLEQYIKQLDELRASGNELAPLVLNEGIRPFIRGCVQLCWLMTVQDPPLHFGPDPDSSQPIDTNTYKFYTKTGTCIDYVVWPPLFLYKDGPLLYKGIAQGHTPTNEKSSEGDRLSARERRREHVSSTIGRTTYNSSSRQTDNPPPHNDSGNSSPGQSKVNDHSREKDGYRQKRSDESGQKISSDEKGTGANSTRSGKTTDTSYSTSSQTPTLEEWRLFLNYAQTYESIDSTGVKAALGDRYQVCLNYYNRRIQQRRPNQSTNI